MGRRLLDTLFPPRCAGCRRRGHWLCPACLARIEPLLDPMCVVCRRPVVLDGPSHGCHTGGVRAVSAVGLYTGPLREAVHALKYHGRHGVAATLAALLAPRLANVQPGDVLAPVPLHPARERERGYNQSEIVARELARLLPGDVAATALRRERRTADQVGLSAARRADNVRGAFAASGDAVRGRRVWLVDDVCTTGATLREAGRVLRAAGAVSVHAAVVATVSAAK